MTEADPRTTPQEDWDDAWLPVWVTEPAPDDQPAAAPEDAAGAAAPTVTEDVPSPVAEVEAPAGDTGAAPDDAGPVDSAPVAEEPTPEDVDAAPVAQEPVPEDDIPF